MSAVSSVKSGVRSAASRTKQYFSTPGQPVGTGFNALPGLAKLIIVAGAAYAIYKLAKAPAKIKQGSGSRSEERAVNQEFDQLNSNPNTKATLTKSQMDQYANQLFQAMDGYGTTEETILSVFKKVKNDADVLGIVKSYGIREVSSGRFNPEPNLKGTLAEALTSELSSSWLETINKTLKAKKIKYNFA